MTDLTFKISTGLKDILGRDLIPDDHVAIFELVKNSFDAHATKVSIDFLDLYGDNPTIIIEDNGKGLDLNDIENKWLFVAYSAKKTEEEDQDYRGKIFQDKPYAGSKGIGRFSCDRLGSNLILESVKDATNAKKEILEIDWTDFEKSLKNEFVDVTVKSKTEKTTKKHGTKLIITNLRSSWDREKLKTLKRALAKLINPSSSSDSFSIFINCPDEKLIDNEHDVDDDNNRINGEVKNFIFEALEIKTSKINVSISTDGEEVETELIDGGALIYKIVEKNTYKYLSNIKFNVFYLNQSAKSTFTRRMGLRTIQYGSIFLYKNSIRIYPYGEPGDDTFLLDKRKAQKPSIFVGNKDLIGRIEIIGDNPYLRETSSRGDGLIKTDTYDAFLEFFIEVVIKRLERYVIGVQKFGGEYINIEDEIGGGNEGVLKARITELIAKIADTDNIIHLEYDEDFLNIIDEKQSDSATGLVENLFHIASETGNVKLESLAKKTEKRVYQLNTARIEAEVAAEKAEKEAKEARVKEAKAKKEAKDLSTENLFLKSIKSQDLDEVVSLMHHVGIYAGTVDNYLAGIYQKLSKGKAIDANELFDIIKIVSLEIKKILNISKFATKANFKLSTEFLEISINEYVKEYIENVLKAVTTGNDLEVVYKDISDKKVHKSIKPIELNIIIDNLVNNAKKAGATKVIITMNNDGDDKVLLIVADNGNGVAPENIDKIYDFGFTTTTGSGLGLFHIKKILSTVGGDIRVESNAKKGTKFTITI